MDAAHADAPRAEAHAEGATTPTAPRGGSPLATLNAGGNSGAHGGTQAQGGRAQQLFAKWDNANRSSLVAPGICIIRISSLTLVSAPPDCDGVYIAASMRGGLRRFVRSHEIALPAAPKATAAPANAAGAQTPQGSVRLDVDITFTVQYPHILKTPGSIISLTLRRRKHYKGQRILGYKVLAMANISMAEVVECPVERAEIAFHPPKVTGRIAGARSQAPNEAEPPVAFARVDVVTQLKEVQRRRGRRRGRDAAGSASATSTDAAGQQTGARAAQNEGEEGAAAAASASHVPMSTSPAAAAALGGLASDTGSLSDTSGGTETEDDTPAAARVGSAGASQGARSSTGHD
eukprot:Opistho-1_new@826